LLWWCLEQALLLTGFGSSEVANGRKTKVPAEGTRGLVQEAAVTLRWTGTARGRLHGEQMPLDGVE